MPYALRHCYKVTPYSRKFLEVKFSCRLCEVCNRPMLAVLVTTFFILLVHFYCENEQNGFRGKPSG
jgi:hypothetical protein